MESENQKRKCPKWLSIPLWVFGTVTAYVAVSCFWHAKVSYAWVGPTSPGSSPTSGPPDPFGAPDYPVKIPGQVLTTLDSALYDFPSWYREATNPLRRRSSPDGTPYFEVEDYSLDEATAHLRAIGEPSLLDRDTDDKNTYFRFTFVPTFSHMECFRLITTPSGKTELISLQSQGQGGFFPGKIRQKLISILKPQTVAGLIAESRSDQFWKKMTDVESSRLERFDNSIWVFEESTPTHYQMTWIINPFTESERSAASIEQFKEGGIRLPYSHAELGWRLLKRANFGSSFDYEPAPFDNGPEKDPFE